jgi:serine/threonine-protein kinase
MELVDGETLQDRLQRGRLKPQEALTIAREIALALQAAHQKGVLHRDLKPSNIRLVPDGRVKLLDFGLARAVREAVLDSRLDTETSPRSEPGAVLGTAPYMSPEQARGQEVDRRSDVWAFGCVLFEMLAGKRAFEGETFSDTVAAVLEHEPEWEALPHETPASVRRLLRRCLQKDKDKRLHDVADARLELEELLQEPTSTEQAPPSPRRPASWAAIVTFAVLLGGFISWLIQRPAPVRKDVVRFAVEWSGNGGFVLSPTGERIVYTTSSGLIVRELDKQEGRLLPGTAGAYRPFFSPDGTWLGFNDPADSSLKKIALTGGAALTVCKGVAQSFGATWGSDDTIVFTPDNFSGLWLVPASGGEPRELTKPDRARGEKSHRLPHYLPGGKAVLFTVGTSRLTSWDDARIEALVLPTGARRTILEGGTSAVYVESGHIVYRRGTSILAAPFDLERLVVTGDPVGVVDGVLSTFPSGTRCFTVARTGLLAYMPQQRMAERLVLVDRAGRARALSAFVPRLVEPRLSPDARSVAVRREAANVQVWLFDIERATFSQLTFEWDNYAPVWTPDGESLIVSSTPGRRLHRVRADGGSRPEPLAGVASGQDPSAVTPDGKLLLIESAGTDMRWDIWILPLEPPGPPRVFLQTPAYEGQSAISPDGRLVAYMSDESGQMEVYVRSFPDGGSKLQVSSGGGFHPVWARSGKELFYRVKLEGTKRRMMVVDILSGNPIRLSRARNLFEDSYEDFGNASFDVFPDGQHFVMIEVDREEITHFNVVLNWFEELKRLVPTR